MEDDPESSPRLVGVLSPRYENSFQSLCWKATEVLVNDYSSAGEQEGKGRGAEGREEASKVAVMAFQVKLRHGEMFASASAER